MIFRQICAAAMVSLALSGQALAYESVVADPYQGSCEQTASEKHCMFTKMNMRCTLSIRLTQTGPYSMAYWSISITDRNGREPAYISLGELGTSLDVSETPVLTDCLPKTGEVPGFENLPDELLPVLVKALSITMQ